MEKGKSGVSTHILSAAANLIGFCFVVLTSMKLFNLSKDSYIDEFTMAALVLFISSSLFSYLSIRSKGNLELWLERFADIVFIFGLFTIFTTTILFAFDVIK